MEKITFNLSDSEINEIVYKALSPRLYWIKKIERQRPQELRGTTIVVRPIDEADESIVEIQFLDGKLEVEGCDVNTIRKLYVAYYKAVTDKIPEYKKQYNDSLEEIAEYVNEYQEQVNNQLLDFLFEEGGFLSTNAVKDKINSYRMAGIKKETIALGNHVRYVQLKQNRYNKPNREICAGEVYVVNFDPVVDQEYGGIRPAIIVGYSADRANFVCVPLSTKEDQGISIGEFNEQENYAVTSRMKIVSPVRIYKKIGEIENKIYENVVKNAKSGTIIVSSLGNAAESEESQTLESEEDRNDDLLAVAVGEKVFPISNDNLLKGNSFSLKVVTPSIINCKQFEVQAYDPMHLEMISKEIVYPTEEEYVEIITKKVEYLKNKKNLRFITNGKNKESIAYEFKRIGNTAIVKVNPNHSDPANGYYTMIYEISENAVKCTSDFYPSGKVNDRFVKDEFLKMMIRKNERYYLILMRNLVRSFSGSYKKHTADEEDEETCSKELEFQISKLQEIMDSVGIKYDGDFEALILSGDRAIDYSLVNKAIDNEGAELE